MYTHPSLPGIRPFCISILVSLLVSGLTYAQSTNLEVYQEMAAECLEPFADTLSTLTLKGTADTPYLHEKALQGWLRRGNRVVLADSLQSLQNSDTGLQLVYRIDRQDLEYLYRNRRNLKRQFHLELQMRILSQQQEVLANQQCTKTYSDSVRRSQISDLEHAAYPETRAVLPTAGWVKRYLEPGVLISASALGVYLFFNLRSTSNSDA